MSLMCLIENGNHNSSIQVLAAYSHLLIFKTSGLFLPTVCQIGSQSGLSYTTLWIHNCKFTISPMITSIDFINIMFIEPLVVLTGTFSTSESD